MHREVLDEVLGVGADGAVKDGLPAPLQQQQLVEGLQRIIQGFKF